MEPDTGNLAESLLGGLSKKHVVEVRSTRLLHRLNILKRSPPGISRSEVSLAPVASDDFLTRDTNSFSHDASGEQRYLESRVIFLFDSEYNCPKIYDWVLTLPHEVDYIWRARWNLSKALYLLTRYTPFAPVFLAYQSGLLPRRLAQPPACFRYLLSFDCVSILDGSVDLY